MRYAIATLIALALGVLLVAAIKGSIEERKQWEVFKIEHECRVVGRKQAQTSVGTATVVRPDGGVSVAPVTTFTAGQTAWECNDGVTYWRNN